MKGKINRKLLAGVMGAAMTLSSVASSAGAVLAAGETGAKAASASGAVVYSTDFEDGDISYFSNRGDRDTTELSIATDEAVSGKSSLYASGRSNTWNGPAFHLDKVCEPNTEYYVSFKFRGKYYTSNTVSFQYNDPDGTPHYNNLIKNISTSEWYTVKDLKISFTEEMVDPTLYIEDGQDPIYIDDFTITEVPVVPIETDIKSVRKVFADDFKIGTAITADNLSSKSFMDLVAKHFSGSLTAGNEMKPQFVLGQAANQKYAEENDDDTNPQVNFSAAKPMLNYCRKYKIPVRVHTLVWHSQTPDWFFKEGYKDDGEWVSKEKMIKRMENYIKNYFTELTKLYPDVDFYACDVVNEAFTDQGTPRSPGEQGNSGSEKSAWVQVFGDNSFIDYAFEFAREYAPKGCKLYYNDFNEWSTGKTNAMIDLATRLKAKGVLDGLGLQCHCNINSLWPQPFQYDQLLTKLEGAGVDIQVTEFDATIESSSSDNLEKQKKFYSEMMDIMEKHADSISAVVFWGVTDDRSWRKEGVPLLFGGDYMAKSAYYGVVGDREEKDIPDITPVDPTTKPTEDPDKDIVWGDADCDGAVKMNDAVLIMQSISNGDRFGEDGTEENRITAKGKRNANVYENKTSGITPQDALRIQEFLLNKYTTLDPNA